MTTEEIMIEVTPKQLKAALLFAAKNDSRKRLEGVCIEHGPLGSRLLATDGHRLLCVNLGDAVKREKVLRYVIARDVVEPIVKGFAKLPSVAIHFEQDAPTLDPERPDVKVVSVPRIHIHGVATVDVQAADNVFPDYTEIVPEKCSGKLAQFNPSYISDCAKASELLEGKAAYANIAHNGHGPALVDVGPNALAIVMPLWGEVAMTPPAWYTGNSVVTKKVAA
jgi:hypothetical protein